MFNLGIGEIVVTMLIALIALGPERLPVAARRLGEWARRLRALAAQAKEEMRAELEKEGLADIGRIGSQAAEALSEARDKMRGLQSGVQAARMGSYANALKSLDAMAAAGAELQRKLAGETPVRGAGSAQAAPTTPSIRPAQPTGAEVNASWAQFANSIAPAQPTQNSDAKRPAAPSWAARGDAPPFRAEASGAQTVAFGRGSRSAGPDMRSLAETKTESAPPPSLDFFPLIGVAPDDGAEKAQALPWSARGAGAGGGAGPERFGYAVCVAARPKKPAPPLRPRAEAALFGADGTEVSEADGLRRRQAAEAKAKIANCAQRLALKAAKGRQAAKKGLRRSPRAGRGQA